MKFWYNRIWLNGTYSLRMLIYGCLLLGIAACAQPIAAPGTGQTTTTEASDTPGAVTIRLMCWEGTIGTRDIVVDELIPGFTEQHPNINVEYEVLPWAEYWTKIAATAAAGNMPDIYCNSVAYLWDHANRGMSANLQPYFDNDLNPDDYFMELAVVERYPDGTGDLYGFPFRWVVGALFYNKQLFDEAGLDYPTDDWTYSDVLEAARALTKDTTGDGETDQWGILAGTNHIFLDSLIKSNGGQVISDDYSRCMLTEPEAIEAIRWMTDLVEQGVSPSPSVAQGFAQGIFPSGQVAMMVDGSYQTVPWHQIEDFEWDVVMQPRGTVDRIVYGGPDSLSISRQSPHVEQAWEFLKYMISPEIQQRGDIIGLGSLPILQEAAYSEAWIQAAGQPDNAQVFADSGPYVQGADFGSQWIEWRATIMNAELSQALLGQRSVEESAAAACQAIDAVLVNIEVTQ
jgi:multiple sugar transport system substrate-binding protein